MVSKPLSLVTTSILGQPPREFWHDSSRYGLIHYSADAKQHQQKSICVLIFVHGVLGDASKTWGDMPRWVLENAQLDMDVISFSYPSRPWHRISMSQAAYDLKTWIETEFYDYRHLIFVTHSTGGLIVKQLLNQANRSEKNLGLWGKTRQVINIAVPHTGGSPFLTTSISVLYRLIFPLLAPVLRLIRFLSQGKTDWGRNRIITALRWKNPWLLELDKQFLELLYESHELQQPTPVIVDICAESDQSVPQSSDQSRRQIHIRGTHKTVKIPRRSKAPIVGVVTNIVRQYPQDISLTVVDRSLMRIVEVNHAAGFKSLIKSTQAHESHNNSSPIPTTIAGAFGSQDDVCRLVIDRIMEASDRPTRIVVTGAGGVGKSTVMRMATWRLGCDYLADPSATPIPLFIPLQQVTVTDASEQAYSWETLWAWWLRWAQSLFPNKNCTMEWLEKKFETEAVAIILDGLDDFLVNHPNISLSAIVNLLRSAVHQYSSNTKLSIVIAIRNDIHGLDRLADDPSATYEIHPLSRQQAIENFPACHAWLSSVQDIKLLEKILTPLVLNNYKPPAAQRLGPSALTQTSILNQIIETFLRNSRLIGTRLKNTSFVELEHLFISLAIIAWLFFYQSRGEINRGNLCTEAAQFRKRWERYFAGNVKSRERENFITACEIIEDIDLCTLLLNSEVFISTGPNMFRFTHRNWQELLLARFFLNCVHYRYFDDFGRVKLYSGIYRMAGEMYQGPAIAAEQVQDVIDAWRKSGNTYVTGNFIGFLSWTVTPIDAQAIELLLAELKNFKGLSRIILIGGLGYRLLVNNPHDQSISDIRRALFPTFIEYANPKSCPVFAPIASSLAWCYQKAFCQKFDIPEPTTPWPALHFDDALTLKILPMVTTITDKPSLTGPSRSLQQALLTPILDTYRHPEYIVRAVHYLYILVIAEKHRVHAFAVSQELPLLLASGSEFENLVAAFDLVPEVMDLYRSCQQLHNQLELVITRTPEDPL